MSIYFTSKQEAFHKGDTMSTNKSCPVSGGFCWRNPLQVALFLAALPYAVKTVSWVWGLVSSLGTAAATVK